MKTILRTFLCVAVLGSFAGPSAFSQGASAVIDQALIDLTRGNHNSVMALLQKQLEEAEKQATSIQTQLDRMGDPRDVTPPAVSMAKEDILRSVAALKTQDEQREVMTGLTGAEVFDDDAFGLMDPIGDKVTLEDGSEVDRDPEKYKLEAGLRVHLNEYYAIRDEAIEKQQALGEELGNVLEELETAEDFATVQKLGAMVTVLQGQIDQWNQKVAIAHDDVVMAEKEFQSTARVVTQGSREAALLQTAANQQSAVGGSGSTGGTTPGFTTQSGTGKTLPWGRKGTEGNPGSGGTSE